MKKIIALILILSLAGLILAACAESGGGAVGGDDNQPQANITDDPAAAEPDAEQDILMHSIPDSMDFGGYTFTILNTIQSDRHYVNMMMEPLYEEITGEIINDAAFRRSTEIQDRYNANIVQILAPGGSRNTMFRNSAMAGDNAYDIASLTFGEAFTAAQQGLIFDINQLAYVDLDAPWWDQNARESLSIMHRVFFLPGAYEVANFDMTRIILFNKQLMQDYQIPYDVYQLVEDGQWTMDRFFRMAAMVSEDLNGDGIFDHLDLYGVASTADHVVFGSFMMGAGERMVRKDADDIPYFAAGTDRFVKVFQFLVENFYTDNFYFNPRNVAGSEEWMTNMFNENRLLFYNITFNRVPVFRGMDADFGILPIPKFDEMQENHYNESGNGKLAIIPVSAEDPQRSGAFLELYAYYGWRYVVPAYKEISLQTMFARDDESAAMVDLIDVSRVYDQGRLFWGANAYDPFVTLFGNRGMEVASLIERHTPGVERAIQRTMDALWEHY